ncbi:hypothetical protein PMAYCL1PPCAC_16838, partial [Pristionchus mayeri]
RVWGHYRYTQYIHEAEVSIQGLPEARSESSGESASSSLLSTELASESALRLTTEAALTSHLASGESASHSVSRESTSNSSSHSISSSSIETRRTRYGEYEVSQFGAHCLERFVDLLTSCGDAQILRVLDRVQLHECFSQLSNGRGDVGTTLGLLSLHLGVELSNCLLYAVFCSPLVDGSLDLGLGLVLILKDLEEGLTALLRHTSQEGRRRREEGVRVSSSASSETSGSRESSGSSGEYGGSSRTSRKAAGESSLSSLSSAPSSSSSEALGSDEHAH